MYAFGLLLLWLAFKFPGFLDNAPAVQSLLGG